MGLDFDPTVLIFHAQGQIIMTDRQMPLFLIVNQNNIAYYIRFLKEL